MGTRRSLKLVYQNTYFEVAVYVESGTKLIFGTNHSQPYSVKVIPSIDAWRWPNGHKKESVAVAHYCLFPRGHISPSADIDHHSMDI